MVCVDLADEVEGSTLVAAWLKRSQLTKSAQLFADYCSGQLTEMNSDVASDAPHSEKG